MSIFNRITRKIVSLAVDLHIGSLRFSINAGKAAYDAAERDVDVANAGLHEAQAIVDAASAAADTAWGRYNATKTAALAEAEQWGRSLSS